MHLHRCSAYVHLRARHDNILRNQSFFDLQAAGFSAELEKPGLLPPRGDGEGPPEDESGGGAVDANQRRPADVYVAQWHKGFPAAWDFAVTSGLRADLLSVSAMSGEAAAEKYEELKRSHLDTDKECSDAGVTFLPIVVGAHGGGWGAVARRAFALLAQRVADTTGEDAAIVADQHAQPLNVLLHKENARAVLRRLQRPQSAPKVARLSAAAMLDAWGGQGPSLHFL